MPNQPKTPVHGFRIPDDLYSAAQAAAKLNGESLTEAVRSFLAKYVSDTERRVARRNAARK